MIRRIVEKSSTMRIFMFLSKSTSVQSKHRRYPDSVANHGTGWLSADPPLTQPGPQTRGALAV
ncbi:hypothetical protein KAM426_23470 [Aquipseudomonas alcaligenes]|nr:hypothetical protein KAM426_23470 [Pseudomonas alcaligenes]